MAENKPPESLMKKHIKAMKEAGVPQAAIAEMLAKNKSASESDMMTNMRALMQRHSGSHAARGMLER